MKHFFKRKVLIFFLFLNENMSACTKYMNENAGLKLSIFLLSRYMSKSTNAIFLIQHDNMEITYV